MMDSKLMAILQKAKAVDTATSQMKGEKRTPSRKQYADKSYFDEPEPEHLTSEQVRMKGVNPTSFSNTSSNRGSSGGLFDQMGVTDSMSVDVMSTPSVDRMDVNSPAYTNSVKNSKLPEPIRRAMLENPIPQPSSLSDVSEEFIKAINPNWGRINESPQTPISHEIYDDGDEKDFYEHPINPQVKAREIPRTQPHVTETTDLGEGEIRKMIAQEIAKAGHDIFGGKFEPILHFQVRYLLYQKRGLIIGN